MSTPSISAVRRRGLRLALPVILLAAAFGARAQGFSQSNVFIQGGVGDENVYALTVGASSQPFWRSAGGGFTAHGEAYVSYWNARALSGGRKGFAQLAVVPLLRYRFDGGRSAWFAEGGIGLSWMVPRYRTADKTFSTRFNFSDNLAVGFNPTPRDEVSLRLQHTSNGGYRSPNPGQNLVQLRYARGF